MGHRNFRGRSLDTEQLSRPTKERTRVPRAWLFFATMTLVGAVVGAGLDLARPWLPAEYIHLAFGLAVGAGASVVSLLWRH